MLGDAVRRYLERRYGRMEKSGIGRGGVRWKVGK
jgi:hypothetical protein